jgi:hypothetical protein
MHARDRSRPARRRQHKFAPTSNCRSKLTRRSNRPRARGDSVDCCVAEHELGLDALAGEFGLTLWFDHK